MKKITLLALLLQVVSLKTTAQCSEPLNVPYTIDAEAVTIPALPDCMSSVYNTFASQEIFKSAPGPVNGFSGNVLSYDTRVNTEFGLPEDAMVSVFLNSPDFQLTQGTSYIVSYKYGNSDSQKAIDNLRVDIGNMQSGSITLGNHNNITGAMAATFTSQPFTATTTGAYKIYFDVSSTGSQGKLYIDDITITATPMSVNDNFAGTVTVSPNPAREVVNVSSTAMIQNIAISNALGQSVYSGQVNAPDAAVNIAGFQSGIYFVTISTQQGVKRVRVIKE